MANHISVQLNLSPPVLHSSHGVKQFLINMPQTNNEGISEVKHYCTSWTWTGQSQSGTSSLSSTPTTLLELTKISSNIGPKLIYECKTEKPSVSIISFPEDKSKKLTIKCISFVLKLLQDNCFCT